MSNELKDKDYPLGRGNDNHPSRVFLNDLILARLNDYEHADKCSSREYSGRLLPSRQEIISDIIQALTEYVRYFKERTYLGTWVIVDVASDAEKLRLVRNHISNKFNKLIKKQQKQSKRKRKNRKVKKNDTTAGTCELSIEFSCSSLDKIESEAKDQDNFSVSMAEISSSLQTFSISARDDASSQLSSQRSHGFDKIFLPRDEQFPKSSQLCYSYQGETPDLFRNRAFSSELDSGCRRCPAYTGPIVYGK